MVEFRMPSLGADMEAGTLVEWLVKPGDWVKRGDVVAVVDTQKGAIEIETYQAGQIEKILVDLHSKVPVGTPLAQIRTEGEGKSPPPSRPLRRRQRRHPLRLQRRCLSHLRHRRHHELLRRHRRPSLRAPRLVLHRPQHASSPKSAASIFQPSPAAARAGRSPMPTSSAVSARLSPLRRQRSGRSGSICRPCE